MIYLDNGATTFPKPQNVINAVNAANKFYSANPGRAGHNLAIKASEMVYNTRKTVAEFFGVKNPENVVFTLNCTMALNTVIKGLCHKGDHIIISSYEHNAVLRPVEKLKQKGIITYSIAKVYEKDNDKTLESFRKAINENTRLCICTCASNVFGNKLPFERIASLCHQYNILCCVDGAQGGGLIPIDLSNSSVDYLCIAGHKGLYGPMGTGALIINTDIIPDSLIEGGTGSNSALYNQPYILPDKFESGTNNFSGIAGLGQGIAFVKSKGQYNIYKEEMKLISYLYDELSQIKNVVLYTEKPDMDYYVPVLSFNIKNMNSDKVSEYLNDKFNIATRSGLHCAPLAHKSKNTLSTGTVRVVPSAFSTKKQLNTLINAISYIK